MNHGCSLNVVEMEDLNRTGVSETMIADSAMAAETLTEYSSDLEMLSEMMAPKADSVSVSSDSDFAASNCFLDEDLDDLSSYLSGKTRSPSFELMTSNSSELNTSKVNQSSDGWSLPLTTSNKKIATKAIKLVLAPSSDAPSMSKNAVAARENRQRKKKYLQGLEESVKYLNKENEDLKNKLHVQEETIGKLNDQVEYLRNVLANQSTLSALLQNIQNTPGVKFQTSWSAVKTTGEKAASLKPGSNENKEENSREPLRRSKRKCAFENDGENRCGKVKKELSYSDGNAEKDAWCNGGNAEKMSEKAVCEAKVSQVISNSRKTEVFCSSRQNECEKNLVAENCELSPVGGGVCLHVTGSSVSVEFCVYCNRKARSSPVLSDHSYVRAMVNS